MVIKDSFIRPYCVSTLFIGLLFCSGSFTVIASERAAVAASPNAGQLAENGFVSRVLNKISAAFSDGNSNETASDRKALYESGIQQCQQIQNSSAGRSDPALGFNCYRLEATKGNPKAQLKLGFAYHDGIGTEKNLMLSYVWHTVAWSRDGKIGRRYVERVSKELNVAELDEAKTLVRKCKESSFKDCSRQSSAVR